jgi:hypothetical protein
MAESSVTDVKPQDEVLALLDYFNSRRLTKIDASAAIGMACRL